MRGRSRSMVRVLVATGVSALAFGMTGVGLAGVSRESVATRVTVTFSDTSFRLSSVNLQAGPTTFVVVNKGKKHHAFAISGPGLHGAQTGKLVPGGSATLTVKLRAGAYVLSDPVGLSAYNVQFLDINPATDVSGTGTTNVVAPTVVLPPMCGGGSYTP